MDPYNSFKAECLSEIELQGSDNALRDLSREWMNRANRHKYSYHFEWMGRPIIQYPQDVVALQEIIWAVKPDLVIETGIAHGGSLIFSASMLVLLDYCNSVTDHHGTPLKRKVLGIDIDIREHNRLAIESHPLASKIDLIQGSSTDQPTIDRVKEYADGYNKVLVILDSNHTHDHVLSELRAYAPLVTIGSYCVVFDTVIEDMPADMFQDRNWGIGDNPKTAVWAYLKETQSFEIDRVMQDKLLTTVAPDGFLKRKA